MCWSYFLPICDVLKLCLDGFFNINNDVLIFFNTLKFINLIHASLCPYFKQLCRTVILVGCLLSDSHI